MAGARHRLVAVEDVDFAFQKTSGGCQLFGNIRPVAVIICDPDKTYAFDMDAKPIDTDTLKHRFPELDIRVVALNHPSQEPVPRP